MIKGYSFKIELYCNQCNKYYTIKEAKKNKF